MQRALRGEATPEDAARFFGHMLMESARMSIEDGLVMQVHFGSCRNHNQALFERFGPDMGCDIPFQAEFTRNLRPLLNHYGNDPRLTLIVFTLDESTYTRELAPLAGHYPALKLGPPWWFHDSLNGMRRYFDQVMETAGLYNTVGFNDDTRAFPSIPARHDLWRRVELQLAGRAGGARRRGRGGCARDGLRRSLSPGQAGLQIRGADKTPKARKPLEFDREKRPMTQPITKAIVPAAGLGTRLLPATKSQPKEMLPVGRKPVVQYVVEELQAAGLSQMLIVTGRRKRAIEDHFDVDPLLASALQAGRQRGAPGQT